MGYFFLAGGSELQEGRNLDDLQKLQRELTSFELSNCPVLFSISLAM